jgi:dTDP-4-amino-4,6-dideoxygalactose transaminase
MSSRQPLAILGAKPRFREPLPVGQFYWPEWEQYEKAARDIFSRRYYVSQRAVGPLVDRLQRRLQELLGVRHAVPVGNATIGLLIATHTLGLRGKVIVPSWTSVATVESLGWSNCQPVFCDIDPQSQQISPAAAKRLLSAGEIKGILGVHLWGDASPVLELEKLAREYGVALYFDAAHAFGCRVNNRAIGTFGQAEVFSFQAANILSTGEGGCLVTNDDALASKFRAMRGDHVSGTGVALQSATSRMSEIQAAVALMMLDDFERNRQNNEVQHRHYQSRLSSVAGIEILNPAAVTTSNFQCMVGTVDEKHFGLTRDELLAVLRAENVAAERPFHPSNHHVRPFSDIASDHDCLQNTEAAAQSTFQLPIGALVTADHIDRICDIISEAHVHSAAIKSAPVPAAAT